MDTLLRSLGKEVCTKNLVVGALCVIGFVVYEGFALYLSWSTPPATDLSAIEQRLNSLEAKQDDVLKLLQPQQAPQLSSEQEAALAGAYQHMAMVFDRYLLDQKLQGPPAF